MTRAAKKPTHGGKRKGAGRPRSEPTRVFSMRVPAALLDRVLANHPMGFVRGYLLAALKSLG